MAVAIASAVVGAIFGSERQRQKVLALRASFFQALTQNSARRPQCGQAGFRIRFNPSFITMTCTDGCSTR